jgi:hypothetical protein
MDRAGVSTGAGGRTAAGSTLFTSEFAAALILDHHINAPGDAKGAPRRAAKRIPAAVAPMSDDWLIRFAIDYMGVRQLSDKSKRDDRILRNHDKGATAHYAGLKPEPGTFGGWPP